MKSVQRVFALIAIAAALVLSASAQQKPKWTCPQGANQACASFVENNETVLKGDYACFRSGRDEYFIVSTSHIADWDTGAAFTVSHGVHDILKMPAGVYEGKWRNDHTTFEGEGDGQKMLVNPDEIMVGTDQHFVTINRRTGRYLERWLSNGQKEEFGRCVTGDAEGHPVPIKEN